MAGVAAATGKSSTEVSLGGDQAALIAGASPNASWKALSVSLPVGLLYALSVPAPQIVHTRAMSTCMTTPAEVCTAAWCCLAHALQAIWAQGLGF